MTVRSCFLMESRANFSSCSCIRSEKDLCSIFFLVLHNDLDNGQLARVHYGLSYLLQKLAVSNIKYYIILGAQDAVVQFGWQWFNESVDESVRSCMRYLTKDQYGWRVKLACRRLSPPKSVVWGRKSKPSRRVRFFHLFQRTHQPPWRSIGLVLILAGVVVRQFLW